MSKKTVCGFVLALVVAVSVFGSSLSAEELGRLPDGFPKRPITMVAPFGFGGGWDMFGRSLCLAARVRRDIQMQLINKPGGHGIIAMNFVNGEPADGYTILGLEGSQIIGMAEGKTKLSLLEDFIPILKAVETPMAIFARTDSPYKTFNDLVAAIKANPDKVTIGATDAVGGVFNVAAIQVFKNAGTDIKYMSFAGESSRMLPAALGGHVDAVLDVVSVFDPHVKAGKMRSLCVLTDERLPQYPDTPTLKELGYDVGVPKHWRGMAVKKGTPADRVELIRKVLIRGLKSNMFAAMAKEMRTDVTIVEGEEFREFLKGQLETFKVVLKDLGMTGH